MNTAKEEVKLLLNKLPDDCTIEDIQYHLYVIEKIQRGIDRAKEEGTVSQEKVEKRFAKWLPVPLLKLTGQTLEYLKGIRIPETPRRLH